MKHQSVRDRLDEGEGMARHEMHKHSKERRHAHFENEVDTPSLPPEGHKESGMGLHEFKGEADSIAYGQSGKEGCYSDDKKIMEQMKHYHWD